MDFIGEVTWGMRNLDKVNHWQRLNLDKYDPDNVVVFYFSCNVNIFRNDSIKYNSHKWQ